MRSGFLVVLVGAIAVVVAVWFVVAGSNSDGADDEVSDVAHEETVISSTSSIAAVDGDPSAVESAPSTARDAGPALTTVTTVVPVLVEITSVLESMTADPSMLEDLVAPEIAAAVDLDAALPDGASISPDPDSLVVAGSSAAMFASVTLRSGQVDEFLVVFAKIDGEWLLASTLPLGER